MSVRQKITLLITAAGFLASLIFSGIVLRQMMDQPNRLMDAELENIAQRALKVVLQNPADPTLADNPGIGDKNYWLEIYAFDSGKLLYKSHLAKILKMPELKPDTSLTVSRTIPRSKIYLGQDRQNEVTFRLKNFKLTFAGVEYLVKAGRPMEGLEEEFWHIIIGLGGGLFLFVAVLLLLSYYFAGFILKPVRIINDRARNISEKHLDRRLPTSAKEDEFNLLARTLNQVFDRLENAFIQQKNLLADASHELKTPLTMMRLSLNEIRSGFGDELSDMQAVSLEHLTEQVLRMERLVKSLLDLSALEIAHSTTTDAVDLVPLLNSLTDDYTLLAEARKINLKTQLPRRLQVTGNYEKLNRAFSNLIDNAIKYNHDGGRVQISARQAGNQIIIVISNTGPGVAAAETAKVFTQFYRVEASRAQLYGGTGLGLAIVKRIIELHNGTITFTSAPKALTEVTITLSII